ncbi:MAG: magnesium/cobalt transporter CorA [Chlamydiae bacterium]|nr:magnesium/cobalt transporter CorA [Chlamydiota bacterium]
MSKINLLRYSIDSVEEITNIQLVDITVSETETTWLEVVGIDELNIIEQIGAQIGMHHLAIEDVISIKQRPKIDDYERGIYISLRTLEYINEKIIDEQISIYICKDMVVSFSERASGLFNSLKDNLRAKKGILRNHGADFLAYAIIDTVVDNYFIALNKISTIINSLETELSTFDIVQHLKDIHRIQRQIISVRQSIWPVREVINHLLREEPGTPLLTPITCIYLKDVYDHVVQVIENLDLMRALSRGLQDMAISSMSYRMNEIIKILTIVSTIFVPLTFITSLYGMNFEYMPEIKSKYGYIAVWCLMLGVALFMIRYFRRKRWI